MSPWMLWAGFLLAETILIFTCLGSKAPAIETDLRLKSTQALQANSLDLGGGFVMDGRDAWLYGPLPTAEARAQAEQAVASVSGVRVVHNMLTIGDGGTPPPAVPAPEPPPAAAGAPANTAASTDVQRSIDDLIAGRVVEFDPSSDRLTQRGGALVDEVAGLLARHPEARIEIAGHTDSQGTSRNNLTLSSRRAESVRKRLVAGGVAAARLTAEGYGEDRPIADNRTAAGRLRNRRVEFRVR